MNGPAPHVIDLVTLIDGRVDWQLGSLTAREKIIQLEEFMRQFPQVDLPVKHWFAKGMYARELFIPKGTLLTGKIHKTEHINIVSKGDISVLTEFGAGRVAAPHTMIAQPGSKRVGYAHEDTVWITLHATSETDLEKLEAEVIAKDYAELEGLSLVGDFKVLEN